MVTVFIYLLETRAVSGRAARCIAIGVRENVSADRVLWLGAWD